MMKTLPADIEVMITEDGVYIEVEGFIKFLRATDDVEEEYKDEIVHLNKLAEYLSEHLAEALAQKRLIDASFDRERPN